MKLFQTKKVVTWVLTIGLIVGLSSHLYAQQDTGMRQWSVDIIGGIPYTQFTVGSEFLTPTAGLNIRYATNSRFAIRGNFMGGVLRGNGENWFGQDYENQFARFVLQPQFTVVKNSDFNLSVYAGAGPLLNDVTVSLDDPRGTGNKYAGSSYDEVTFNVNFGSELRARLSPRLDFMVQVEKNYTTTNMMDGYNFNINSGSTVDQVGKDNFVSAMAGFTIKFGSSQKRHAMWKQEPSVEEHVRPLARKVEQLEQKSKMNEKRIEQTKKAIQVTRQSIQRNEENIESLQKQKLAREVDSVQERVEKMAKNMEKTDNEEAKLEKAGSHYVIAGSFKSMDRAMTKLRELKKQGFSEARILPPIQGGAYYRVTFMQGLSSQMANQKLDKYKNINNGAWIYEYHRDPIQNR